jgi:uncharacterized protein
MKQNKKVKPRSVVEVKRSRAGLGLFATSGIKKGQRIIEYKGPLLTNEQADTKGGKYLFEINPRRTIDGSSRKNIARYINHACRPNSEPVWLDRGMWIRAKKNIKAGEEITYHYGKEYFQVFIKPMGCRCQTCLMKRKSN